MSQSAELASKQTIYKYVTKLNLSKQMEINSTDLQAIVQNLPFHVDVDVGVFGEVP